MLYVPFFYLICIVLTLRHVWGILGTKLNTSSLDNFNDVLTVYSQIKSLVIQINELFGWELLGIYLLNTSFMAGVASELLRFQERPSIFIFIGSYLAYNVVVWGGAAQIHIEIQNTLKCWIYKRHSNQVSAISVDERLKVLSFISQVEHDQLGLSCKFFTITFNSIRSVLGLIAAYTIIAYPLGRTI